MKRPITLTSILFVLLACASCSKNNDTVKDGPLDYTLQVIPTIDEIIPADLITLMGPYLHFGDNPPRIDTCFFTPEMHLDTMIRHDSTTTYYSQPQPYKYRLTWDLSGQHRCVMESLVFERRYMENYIYENGTSDSIFIMGEGNDFTVYYRQTIKHLEAIPLTDYPSQLERIESAIITGTVIKDSNDKITGIKHLHAGYIIEYYRNVNDGTVFNYNESTLGIGIYKKAPGIKDILIYSCVDENNHDIILEINPNFQPFEP